MPKDVETRLADDARVWAEADGRRLELTAHHLRALAGILEGHPIGVKRELSSLFAAGILELAPPHAPTPDEVAELLPWPDAAALFLDPRAEITFEVFDGPIRPMSASQPLSCFVVPAVESGLARLAENLRSTAKAMVRNALARERVIEPEEWPRAFHPIYCQAADRAPLDGYLRVVDDPETVFRAEWMQPLQRAECPYPQARILLKRRDRADQTLSVRLPTDALPEASALIRSLHMGRARGDLADYIVAAAAPHHLARLIDAITRCELLTTRAPPKSDWDARLPAQAALAILHLGHAGLLIRGGEAWIAIDPWLVPHDPRYAVQPPAPAQLPHLDAVLITHEHWDHIDVPSMLRYPPGVPVIVPRPDRTGPLHPHYREFLALGGSKNVIELGHWESHALHDGMVVTAIPFTGEGARDERTVRNCYLVERSGKRAFVHVDSSMDSLGHSDVTDGTIARMVAEHGPVDVLYATRRQELRLGYEVPTDLHPVYLGSDPRRFGRLLENCHCPASYLADLAAASRCALVVLYSEGGADWFPEDTNFLRTGDEVAFSGFEYLWDTLEQIADAVEAPLQLSCALDAVVVDDDGIRYSPGPLSP